MDLGVLVLSFLLALRLYGAAGNVLSEALGISRTFANPLGFLGVLVLAQLALGFAANHLLRRIPYRWHASGASRLLAVLPATAYGAVIAAALLLLAVALPIAPGLRGDIESSRLGGQLVDEAVRVERVLAGIFGDAVRETLTFLTVEPEAQESIRLRARPDRLRVDEAAEARMLELVNEERVQHGVRPLTIDPTLVEVARVHSFDMWEREYFGHVNPDGDDPFDRMRGGGASFRAAGENLALAPTVEQAHRGLMNSPGHRRNILDPAFGRIGIGAVDGGVHGLMFTQNFAD
jgi:uncharacterized protein YkwD